VGVCGIGEGRKNEFEGKNAKKNKLGKKNSENFFTQFGCIKSKNRNFKVSMMRHMMFSGKLLKTWHF
jgi:hypothetical protein